MNNIIDYVREYGDKTCAEQAFCEADALVLSQFSYFKLDKTVPPLFEQIEQDMPGVVLADIYKDIDIEYVCKQELYPEENEQLLEAMVSSKRYSTMICNYYLSDTRIADDMQFAALTVQLEGALPIVVFRGTDGTVVGWKEDFNMAFSKPYAGAFMAVRYVAMVAERLSGKFMVAGHSKGGNLSAFSVMGSDERIRQRITDIYSFDGPGFRPEILEEYDYNAISSKVHKFLPKSSLVGIVLEGSKDYVTIKSHAVGGVFQHNPYKWCIDGYGFVEENDIQKKSQIMHNSLNEWIMELDETDISLMIEILFGIIESTNEQTILEIKDNWKDALHVMVSTAHEIDGEKKKRLKRIIKVLIETIVKCLKEQIQEQKQEHGSKPV